jgi:endonuclease-3
MDLLKGHYRDNVPTLTKIARRERNPFLVLIGCLLSLRTKDAVTDAAMDRLMARARTPQEILSLALEELERMIYPVGFYRTKARVLKGVSKTILDEYAGKVPDTMDELLKLKGVGRKTANIVITEGFGKLGIAVDTHVHRISNRLGAVTTKNPRETEAALEKILPQKHWITYNTLLVTHGQKTCSPISPFCSRCQVYHLCGRVGVTKSR